MDAKVSLILALLESEAPSVEVKEEVSGAGITGVFFLPSEEDVGRMLRFRCLKLMFNRKRDKQDLLTSLCCSRSQWSSARWRGRCPCETPRPGPGLAGRR